MPCCHILPLPYHPDPGLRFARIRQAPGAILLDSGRPQATRGRFDLFSAWPRKTFCPAPEESAQCFFQRLREALIQLGEAQLPKSASELPFAGGLMGLLGYDFGECLEPWPRHNPKDLQTPSAWLGLYDWALISDHQRQTSQLVLHPQLAAAEQQRLIAFWQQDTDTPDDSFFALQQAFVPEQSPATYHRAIQKIQNYIRAGDCYQVNYAQRFQARYQGDPWTAYKWLRQACPTPFAGYLALGHGQTLLSLSPERFLRLHQGQVETRPIKGTRPRHPAPHKDKQLAQELRNSVKDLAENVMIVDLLRNDLGRNCQIGSIRVPELFSLESYPNVHHLVSCIQGTLTQGRDAFDLLAGAFPGGSITGAPKIRAMQIIDELEPNQRNAYCGSLLYLDVRGEMDSSIAIRTLLAEDQQLYCWGGGGIVMDSDGEMEYQESLTKVQALMSALENPKP